MAHLASTLREQGRWEEAEQLELQVVETSKTKLGADHPNTMVRAEFRLARLYNLCKELLRLFPPPL
jgi:hypothetical protein